MLRVIFSLFLSLLLAACALPAAALTWHFEIPDQGAGIGAYSSIALGSSGQVYIAYFDGGHGITKFAFNDGAHWTVETLDPQYLSGHYTSVKLDSSGQPHVAYRYYSGHNLRFASRDNGTWTHDDFETDPDMEADCSLALDSSNMPHVAFWDGEYYGEPHDLGYASFDGVSWNTEIVDSPGDVGRNASLALDSHGHPHISYYDQTHVTLKYAHFDGTQWQIQTVDNVEYIGFNFRTAIAVDSHDRVHIVYSAYHLVGQDWYGRLKYATYDGLTWQTQVVDESLPTRDFRVPAIAIDIQDHPRTSYLIYYNSEPITADLKYAAYDGTSWQTEFVDTGDIADSDFSNSIALDGAGRVHISYSRSGSLVHAYSDPPVSVPWAPTAAGTVVELLPPSPNPCQGTARIAFRLTRPGEVQLDLLNVAGQRVANLGGGYQQSGAHTLEIAPSLPAGVYLCRLSAGGEVASRKLVVR